jgi:hypothetical protein
MDESLRSLASSLLDGTGSDATAEDGDVATALLQALQEDAERFVTHEEACGRLSELEQYLRSVKAPTCLAGLYKIQVELGKGKAVHPGAAEIGEWLKSYGTDVLAHPRYKWIREAQSWAERLSMTAPRSYESSEPESYEPTVSVPYTWLELKAAPSLPNLHPFKLIVSPLLSRCDVHVFSGICEYGYKSWTDTKVVSRPDWMNQKIPLKNAAPAESLGPQVRKLWQQLAKHALRAAKTSKDDIENFMSLIDSWSIDDRDPSQAMSTDNKNIETTAS